MTQRNTVEQEQAELLKRMKSQITRLDETVERFKEWTATRIPSLAILEELIFARQVLDAIGQLAETSAQIERVNRA